MALEEGTKPGPDEILSRSNVCDMASITRGDRYVARREFLRWVAGSSVLGPLAMTGCHSASRGHVLIRDSSSAQNVFQLHAVAKDRLRKDANDYLAGGADDMRTVRANTEAYRKLQIRPRRLVDVRNVDTSVELLGETMESPILLAPVGFQVLFHPEGELASARAAASRHRRMVVSSVSNYSVGEIVAAGGQKVWFQLYPTPNRTVTLGLLRRAEDAGCRVVVLTVDTPVLGNRELHGTTLAELLKGEATRLGNYEGIRSGEPITDPGMTWDMVRWLKANCAMQVVLKGIVTGEDAELCLEHGADGVIVSNHGGRQLESDRGTVECLPEVVEVIDGRIAVLIDGGIRRGTDIFKALALGADAICIGRPFCWGLAAFGQSGVQRALDLLHAELVRDMQLAGVTSLTDITRSCLA